MKALGGISDPNRILSLSSQELVNCHQALIESSQVTTGAGLTERRSDELELAKKLTITLENATLCLAKEIDSGRVVRIDPSVIVEMERAVAIAMESLNFVDARVKEIYFSIFGWNTSLWHALNRMQKLLKTIYPHGSPQSPFQVKKVEKSEKERRKRRGQK